MDYIFTISRKFPKVLVSCIGNPELYTNLVWEGGDPIPPDEILIESWELVKKELKWEEIKAERDRRKAGGIKVGEKWYHSDDTSRIQQLGLVMFGASIPPNLMWKTMDGSFIPMTQTLASQIFSSIAMGDQAIFKVAEQKKAIMESLADPFDFEVSGGWPLIFGE